MAVSHEDQQVEIMIANSSQKSFAASASFALSRQLWHIVAPVSIAFSLFLLSFPPCMTRKKTNFDCDSDEH